MRTLKKYILLITALFTLCITSCELTDVTNVEPVFQIDEDNIIKNIDQAERALNGAYGLINSRSQFGEALVSTLPGITGLMGLSQKPGIIAGSSDGESDFFTNDARPDNGYIADYYQVLYKIINNFNHVIEKTGKLETDNPRKKEIIAESKFLRALCHFYLLRLHGEFFDLDSNYGIVLKTEPIENSSAQARSSVKESYELIINDLDAAILEGPDFTTTIYASKLAAKALKSRVLLYQKEYAASAVLANEVINSGQRNLETNFADIFEKKIDNPLEAIFQSNYNNGTENTLKQLYFPFIYATSDQYKALMIGDERIDDVILNTPRGVYNGKFVNPLNTFRRVPDTEYFLRLAEIYLIYAEAKLRSDNTIAGIALAKDAVNMIRNRSGNTPITSNNYTDLLEDIRMEKVFELGIESGEEWFDLVRFHKIGDININDIKPIPSETNLILPMPLITVLRSGNVIIQNPGY